MNGDIDSVSEDVRSHSGSEGTKNSDIARSQPMKCFKCNKWNVKIHWNWTSDLKVSSPLHIFLGTDFQWWWVWSWCRKCLRPETQQNIYLCVYVMVHNGQNVPHAEKAEPFHNARRWLFAPKVKGHAYVCVGVNCVLSGSRTCGGKT